MTQRTLVILKPDAVARGLVGEIIGRIERKAGWTIAAMELRTLERAALEQHYAEHEGRPFYQPLMEFMASGPSVVAVVEGERVIEGVRALAGPTDPDRRPRRVGARRFRHHCAGESHPRLGLGGVGRAGDEDLLPPILLSRASPAAESTA